MATAATTYNRAAREQPNVGFGATLASEWTKMISTRSTWVILGIAAALAVGMTALVSLAVGSTFDEWTAADQATFEPIGFSLSGMAFGSILIIVLGVNLVSGEYTSGMIRNTLAITPRRGRLLAAKVVLISTVAIVASFLLTLGSFLTGQLVLGAFDMPTVSLMDSDVIRMLVGISLTGPLYPLIGATLAFIFRSTATPITLALMILFLPSMIGAILPRWWQENILSLLPGSAADSLALGHLSDSSMYPDPPLAIVTVIAWMIITIGAAYFVLTRRDA